MNTPNKYGINIIIILVYDLIIGETPLHLASWKGHLEVVEVLLDAGATASVNRANLHGINILLILVNDLIIGDTPLHITSDKGHLEVVEYLLVNSATASVHAPGENGINIIIILDYDLIIGFFPGDMVRCISWDMVLMRSRDFLGRLRPRGPWVRLVRFLLVGSTLSFSSTSSIMTNKIENK